MHRGYLLAPTAAFLALACVLLFQFPTGSWVPTWRFSAASLGYRSSGRSGSSVSLTKVAAGLDSPASAGRPDQPSPASNQVATAEPRANSETATFLRGAAPIAPRTTTAQAGDNRTATILSQPPVAIQVLGHVLHPGILAWPEAQFPETVLGAIQAAGGFDANALVRGVRLTRVATDGKATVTLVDVTASIANGQDTTPAALPGDIIFVPQRLKL